MILETVLREQLNPDVKGFPYVPGKIQLDQIGEQDWILLSGDLPHPVATQKE